MQFLWTNPLPGRSRNILLGCFLSVILYPLAIHVWGPIVALALTPAVLSFCLASTIRGTVGLAWVTGTLGSFFIQHTIWVVSLPGTALLACYHGFTWIPIAVGIRSLWRHYKIPLVISWPVAWCAGEALRTLGPLGTPFGTLVVPETTTTWMLQIVDLAGAGFAAFPLALIQGWFADVLLSGWQTQTQSLATGTRNILKKLCFSFPTAVLIMTWTGVWVYGHWRLADVESGLKPGPKLTVVATDILALRGNQSSYDPNLLMKKLKSFSLDAIQASPKPEMIIWPEGMLGSEIACKAFLSAKFDPRIQYQFESSNPAVEADDLDALREQWKKIHQEAIRTEASFQQWVEESGAPILVGMDAWLPGPQDQQEAFELHNAAVMFDPSEGQSEKIQSKCRLYPLGEYSLWEGTILEPWLDRWVGPPRLAYQPGDSRQIFTLKGTEARYVVALCSELKFNHLRGANWNSGTEVKPYDFMVNIANEGLLIRNGMLEIFAFCAQLRAIENRVTVVRSSNAGISGFWSPTGVPYGLVKNKQGQIQAGLGSPEIPLIESLIEFRKVNEQKFSQDPVLRKELNERIDAIEQVRKRASVEGWSTQAVLLSPEITLFQRWGDWLTPLLLTLLGFMNLSVLRRKRPDLEAGRF